MYQKGYLLLSLLNGAELPWSSSKSEKECLQMKKNADIGQIASKLGCAPVSTGLLNAFLNFTPHRLIDLLF
jgi:hypothetical protein